MISGARCRFPISGSCGDPSGRDFRGLRGTRNRAQLANTAKGVAYKRVDQDNGDAVAHRLVIMCYDHKVYGRYQSFGCLKDGDHMMRKHQAVNRMGCRPVIVTYQIPSFSYYGRLTVILHDRPLHHWALRVSHCYRIHGKLRQDTGRENAGMIPC